MNSNKLKEVVEVARDFSRQRLCWLESLKYENTKGQLPILIYNNFFDIALLNWGHLFGNENDELHFKQVLSSPNTLKSTIMGKLGMTDEDWKAHWKSLKHFRDSNVAHIDRDRDDAIVPELDIAYVCVAEYYKSAIAALKAQGSCLYGDDTLDDFIERSADYYTQGISEIFNALKGNAPKDKRALHSDGVLDLP